MGLLTVRTGRCGNTEKHNLVLDGQLVLSSSYKSDLCNLYR